MEKTHPIHQTCPQCQTNRGYLRAVTFSDVVKTLTFRCDGCGGKWDVASPVPITARLTLLPHLATQRGVQG